MALLDHETVSNRAPVLVAAGVFPILFMAAILLISTGGFFVGFGINRGIVPLAFLISFGAILCQVGRRRGRHALLTSASIVVLMIVISLVLATFFLDVTWDGQGYHQSAIIHLANGWNPFYSFLDTSGDRLLKYANFYSKGPWICAAAMYKFTGNIETGKMFNLLLMISAFLLSLELLRRFGWLNRNLAIFTAVIVSLNPVAICQSFSFLIDGQLASIMVIVTCLGILFFQKRDLLMTWGMAAALIVGINIKFNGVAYMGVMLIFLLLGVAVFKRDALTISRMKILIYACLVAILIVGFNPYVTNTAGFGNPFHPILGAGRVDVMKWQRPTNFVDKDRFARLYLSLFSTSANPQILHLESSELKNPFTFTRKEFEPFVQSSLRTGGFGPMFGGVLIVSILFLLIAILVYQRGNTGVLLAVFGTLVSVVINPEAWWARLAPQLWLLPILIGVYLFSIRKKLPVIAGILVLAVLMLNVSGITWSYVTQYGTVNRELKAQLTSLRGVPIVVNLSLFKSTRIRLQHYGIPFREVAHSPQLPCAHPERIIWSTALFCRPDAVPKQPEHQNEGVGETQ